jgi:hypothetical protein
MSRHSEWDRLQVQLFFHQQHYVSETSSRADPSNALPLFAMGAGEVVPKRSRTLSTLNGQKSVSSSCLSSSRSEEGCPERRRVASANAASGHPPQ